MYYTDIDVAHAWANNRENCYGRGNYTHRDGTIKSYNTVIGERLELPNNITLFVVQENSYSTSTSKHVSRMIGAIPCQLGTHVINVAKYGFIYEWRGRRYLDTTSFISECAARLINGFTHELKAIKYSDSLTAENIVTPVSEIICLVDTINALSWTKLSKLNFERWGDVDNKVCRKVVKALKDGLTTIPEIFTAAFGKKEWNAYVYRTLSQRKARETRRAKEIEGYEPIDIEASLEWDSEKQREHAKKQVEALKLKVSRNTKAKFDAAMMKIAEWKNFEIQSSFPSIDTSGLTTKQKEKIYSGGNVFLRMNGDKIQTSKGIYLNVDEAERLWKLVSKWHNDETEFSRNIAHGTTNNWVISSYHNDVLTAGCHQIPYCEMKEIANHLNFPDAV